MLFFKIVNVFIEKLINFNFYVKEKKEIKHKWRNIYEALFGTGSKNTSYETVNEFSEIISIFSFNTVFKHTCKIFNCVIFRI